MATLGQLVVSLSANTAEFTSAMDKAAYQSQKRMGEILKHANQLGAAIGTSLAAGAGAFAIAVKASIDQADDLGKAAEKVGMTTEALSGLQYAAELSGVSAETLSSSMNKLNKSLGDGNPAFAAMGVSIKDANGNLKTADQVLTEVAGKFAGYSNGAEKSALAMEIFGKSGAELIPLLNSGSQGLSDMRDEAQSLGLVLNKETTLAAAEFNDNLSRIALTQTGLVNSLTAQLLPVMAQASEEFVALAKNTDLVTGPANGLKILFQTLAVLGSDLAFVFKMTGTEIGGMAAQLAAFATGDFSGGLAIGRMMKEDAATARAELDAFQARIMSVGQVAEVEAKKAAEGGGIAAPIVAAAKAAKKAKKEIDDLLTPAAKLYASAIGGMNSAQQDAQKSALDLDAAMSSLYNLMTSAEWQQMPETWRATAVEQAKSSSAMIQIANRQKQINDMIAATPTAKLEESRAAMMLLKDEFEAGRITAEQFSEAAGTALGTLPPAVEQSANQIDLVIGNAFNSAADAIADFAMGGKASFGDMVLAMIRDLIKLQAQMAMTAAFKDAGGSAGIFKTIAGLAVSAFSGSGSTAGLDAGSTGAYSSGGTYVDVAHTGGLVGDSSFAQRIAPSSLFANAPRFHSGGWPGLRPDEVPIIAQKGERVLSRQEVANQGAEAGDMQVNVVVNVANDGNANQESSGNGGASMKRLGDQIANVVRGVLVQEMRSGGMLQNTRAA